MKILSPVVNLVAAAVMVLAVGSASAADFDFYKLGRGAGDFLPDAGTSVLCTGGDRCSSNVDGGVFGGAMEFTQDGLTVKAKGWYTAGDPVQVSVVQDHDLWVDTRYGSTALGAGLGVYHESGNTSDDNVTANEMLQLHFQQSVTMTEFGMRAEGHNTTSFLAGASFQYSVDNITWISGLLPDNGVVGNTFAGRFLLAQGLTSEDFYFRFGGPSPIDQFYVSSITVTAAVPEPEIYAMLVAGLGLMGFAGRRRKQKAVAVA